METKTVHRNLTPKQEAFAHAYVETSNASEAYRRTYNVSNMSAPTVWVEACRLLNNPKVALRVQELQDRAMATAGITVAEVIWRLKEDHDRAIELGQFSAAIRALVLLGKHIGMFGNSRGVSEPQDHAYARLCKAEESLQEHLAETRRTRETQEGRVIEGTAVVVDQD